MLRPSKKTMRSVERPHAKGESSVISWSYFRNIFKISSLGQRMFLAIDKVPVLQICEYLQKLSYQKLSTEEVATLQIYASILFLLPNEIPETRSSRAALLCRAFQTDSSLEPMLVHYFTKHLLKHFKLNRTSDISYILNLSNFLGSGCPMGKAVAVNLLWSIVFKCSQERVIMHQHRDLRELHGILGRVSIVKTSLDLFCILMDTVSLLLHLMLCNKWLEEFLSYGYPSFFFRLLPEDARKLQAYLKESINQYKLKNPEKKRRIRSRVSNLLASLNYLISNSTECCLVCRSTASQRNVKDAVCVLGPMCDTHEMI